MVSGARMIVVGRSSTCRESSGAQNMQDANPIDWPAQRQKGGAEL